MSVILPSYGRNGSAANGVEWVDYAVESRGPGQFDDLTGVLEGYWPTPWDARVALRGKKITPPGARGGAYGFYLSDGTIRTSWARGGRVRAEFQAPGLVELKFKKVALNVAENYSLQSVTVGTPHPPGLSAGVYPRLQFRNTRRGYDVTVAWAPTAQDTLDLAGAGKPVTSHWAAQLAAITLQPPGTNPFTGNELTYYYPSGWYYDVQPGDSVGGGKLLIATFAFRHQWPFTL